MGYNRSITRIFSNGNTAEDIQQTKTVTADAVDGRKISVPDETTDHLVNIAIDVSLLKAFYIGSDQDVTVETNNGTTPDDTFTLKKNSPIVWDEDSGLPNPFASGVDVTELYITNTGNGAAANVDIEVAQDSTP